MGTHTDVLGQFPVPAGAGVLAWEDVRAGGQVLPWATILATSPWGTWSCPSVARLRDARAPFTSRTFCRNRIYHGGLCSKGAGGQQRPQGENVLLTANPDCPLGRDRCLHGIPSALPPPAPSPRCPACPGEGLGHQSGYRLLTPWGVTCPMKHAGHRAQLHPCRVRMAEPLLVEGNPCWGFGFQD